MKFLSAGALVVLMMSFVACKKDYTCKCTNVPIVNEKYEIIKDATLGDAKKACDRIEESYNSLAVKVTCSLE